MPQFLHQTAIGQTVLIKKIDDDDAALQALRMGILPGETLKCIAKVPAGPTVVEKSGMELAIGLDLSKKIEVSAV